MKQRKEALLAIKDGLEALLEIEKPEEERVEEKAEEKKPEAPAPDSFGGILQSMIPMLIIPSILPLFQEMLSQTLRSTTVNVKVESSTAIIPIDISSQTAILAVDIRAQTVTLNIRIVDSEVTLNVNITGSGVTIPVSITDSNVVFDVRVVAQTAAVDVNIVSSAIVLDVRITASTVTLNVNIAASAIALDVRLIASTITLNVNIASSAITLNVRIAASAIVLDVRITASTVTLNVNIASSAIVLDVRITASTATLNVNIAATSVTMDVRITAQTVNIQIVNPPGVPLYIGLGGKVKTISTTASLNTTEITLANITGRGRLIMIGGRLIGGSYDKRHWTLRVYVDGETTPSIQLRGYQLDELNGAVLANKQNAGEGWYYADVLPQVGGMTWARHYYGTFYYEYGFSLTLSIEFTSSIRVTSQHDRVDSGVFTGVILFATYP